MGREMTKFQSINELKFNNIKIQNLHKYRRYEFYLGAVHKSESQCDFQI